VGAGIVGLAVVRELLRRRPGAKLIVIDKCRSVAYHQTGHNSGVIHSGVCYKPNSLKARLCVEGARLMYEFCDANAIPYQRCGKLIVALRGEELPRLAELEARGHANGVPGLRRVDAGAIATIEPECRGLAALHSPSTGIADFGAVARAMEQELRGKGVTFARKHSPRLRWVTGADFGQAGAGSGGCQGAPVIAVRRTSMTLRSCLRAVSM
jgi:L-2-hydroxyglutarate oxidase LhgO